MAIWYMNLLNEQRGGTSMFSVKVDYPEGTYVESDTPPEEQEHKGWYWDSETKKFYRWDNSPRSN